MTVTAFLTMAWSPLEARNFPTVEPVPTSAASTKHHPQLQAFAAPAEAAAETRPQPYQLPAVLPTQRLSIFGRSNSIARRQSQIRTRQTISSGQQNQEVTPTLHTSQTVPPTQPCAKGQRSTTHSMTSFRRSILRRRGNSRDDEQVHTSRPSSSQSQVCDSSRGRHVIEAPVMKSNLLPLAEHVAVPTEEPRRRQQDRFNSEKAYDHHRKKSSISFPFNFQHVTHTVSKHLPQLDTVDEKDLPAKFWAFNASQRPKRRLKGIKAEDLGVHRSTSVSEVAAQPPTAHVYSRPLHRTRSLIAQNITRKVDETTFDETSETKIDPHEAWSPEDVDVSSASLLRSTLSKHYISMSALGSVAKSQQLQDQYAANGGTVGRSLPHIVSQAARAGLSPQPAAPLTNTSEASKASGCVELSLPGKSTEAREHSTPTPKADDTKRDSLDSVLSYSMFPMPRSLKMDSAASTTSDRSLESTAPTSATSFGEGMTDVLNEPTWEDDIDFAYTQAAEGSCDFDWAIASSPRTDETLSGLRAGGSGKESRGVNGCLSGPPSNPASVNSPSSGYGKTCSAGTGSLTIELGHTEHGASTGRKSSAAACHTSQDGQSDSSPSVSPNGCYDPIGTQSSDDRRTAAPVDRLPRVPAKSHFPTLNLVTKSPGKAETPRLASRDDGESLSACSYQSSAQAARTVGNTSQWSPASMTSIQNSPMSERTGRSHIRRNATPQPLEAIPQSSNDFNPSLVVPSSPPLPLVQPDKTESVIMRRPETPGDREVLFATGRMVQRGRSATPNRHAIRADAARDGGWI